MDHYGRPYTKPAELGVPADVEIRARGVGRPPPPAAPQAPADAAREKKNDPSESLAKFIKGCDPKKPRYDNDLASKLSGDGSEKRANELLGDRRINTAPTTPSQKLFPSSLAEVTKDCITEMKEQFKSHMQEIDDFMKVKREFMTEQKQPQRQPDDWGTPPPATGQNVRIDTPGGTANADLADEGVRRLWRKSDTGSNRREASAPTYRQYEDWPSSSRTQRDRHPREDRRTVHLDAPRSSSKSRPRSQSRRRDVSRGPDPRVPAPDAFPQENSNVRLTHPKVPISFMSIYNVFDHLLGTELSLRSPFFLSLGDALRDKCPIMKDIGEYTLNEHDVQDRWGAGRKQKFWSGVGSISDIAILNPLIFKNFCRYLSGEHLHETFDADPREPSDNNKVVGILSNTCPTKLQITWERRLAQQSSCMLRKVVSEKAESDNPPVHTVGSKAIKAIKMQYTGEEEYDKLVRAEKRKVHETQTDKLVKALQAPMPFCIKASAYRPGWIWMYDTGPGELKTVFTMHPLD